MDLVTQYGADSAVSAIRELTSQEEAYVRYCIQGLNPSAAARAAGYSDPITAVATFAEREDICKALAYGREMIRQTALASGAMNFTRDDATMLYLEAHSTAENSSEKIRAVDSLVKLHGLAEPEKKEIKITTRDQMQALDSDKLLEIAGSDLVLSPDDYKVTTNERR